MGNYNINKCRAANTPHNERLCKCGQLQTLSHVLFECNIIRCIKIAHYKNDNNLDVQFFLLS